METSSSRSSWFSFDDNSEHDDASTSSEVPVYTPPSRSKLPNNDPNFVNVYVGPELEPFTIHKYMANLFISFYLEERRDQKLDGTEQKLELPEEDPKAFEALVKYIYGKRDELYQDQADPFYGIDTPVHDLMSFKLSLLAAKLRLMTLEKEALRRLEECLSEGWPVTIEAIALAYSVADQHPRSTSNTTTKLQYTLMWGAMKQFFADVNCGEGSDWKSAVRSVEKFATGVSAMIGYHYMRDFEKCEFSRCYRHFPQVRVRRKTHKKAAVFED